MASHLYIPQEPTTILDRILAHSVELAVASVSASSGLFLLAVLPRITEVMPNSSLTLLPWFLTYAIAAFIGSGGVIALLGLLVRKDNIRKELNVEQMGWLLMSAGWSAYVLSVLLLDTGSPISIMLGGFVALGSIGRLAALIILERRTVSAVEANPPTGEGPTL